MSSLGRELQETIRNLETLRDAQDPPSDAVMKNLDRLYEKQIALIEAAINTNTEEYMKATSALQEAAEKTKEAIDDLAKLEQGIEKVADAIGKLTALLASVA